MKNIRISSYVYRDYESAPKVNVKLTNVQITGANLSNTRAPSESSAATVVGSGYAEGKALLKVNSRLRLAEAKPTFELDAFLEDLPITTLNDFLKAYARVDASKGFLSVYTEANAANGGIEGYIKPLVRDLQILDLKQDSDNPLELLWQSIVAGITEVFTNQRKNQIATSVPFSGRIDDPETDTWSAVVSMVANAFVEAIKPGIENRE